MTKIKNMLKKGFTLTELAIVIAVIAILVAVLVPTFISLIDSANESKDTQMIYNLNVALSTETDIETPEDALDIAAENGYNIDKLTPSSDGEIVYDHATKSFALISTEGEVIYPTSNSSLADRLNESTTWYFASSEEDIKSTTASYIITGTWNGDVVYQGTGQIDTSRATIYGGVVVGVDSSNNQTDSGNNVSLAAKKLTAESNSTKTIILNIVSGYAIYIYPASNVKYVIYSDVDFNFSTDVSADVYTVAEGSAELNEEITYIPTTEEGKSSGLAIAGQIISEICTQNDAANTASFVLELGTEKYPWLITDETKLAEKLGNSTLKTVYLQLQNDITLSASTTVKDITSNIVIDGKNNYTLTSSNADFCLENTAKADLSVKLINLNTDKTNIILLNYESVTFESCKIDNSKIYIIGSSSTGSCNVEFSNSKISNDAYTVTSKYGEKDVYLIEIYSLLNEDGQGNDLRLNITSCVINVCGEELFNLHGTSTSGDYGDFKNIDLVLNKVTATLTLSLGDSDSDSFHKLAVMIGTADEDSMYFALINISKTSYTTDCSDSTFCYITLANSPTTYTIKDQDVVNLHSASDFTASAE